MDLMASSTQALFLFFFGGSRRPRYESLRKRVFLELATLYYYEHLLLFLPCLELNRQDIMCYEILGHNYIDSNQEHVCRDLKALRILDLPKTRRGRPACGTEAGYYYQCSAVQESNGQFRNAPEQVGAYQGT